jgi:hypothetical protein
MSTTIRAIGALLTNVVEVVAFSEVHIQYSPGPTRYASPVRVGRIFLITTHFRPQPTQEGSSTCAGVRSGSVMR